MSHLMTQGVIGMPLDLAMSSELSRMQYHSYAQQLLADYEKALARIAELEEPAAKFAIIERCMEQLESDEREAGIWTTCSLILIGSSHKLNSTNSKVTQEAVTVSGECIGDWTVTVERIKEPQS